MSSEKAGMLEKSGEAITKLSGKFFPNPFVFAIILTTVVFLIGIIFTDHGPRPWGDINMLE